MKEKANIARRAIIFSSTLFLVGSQVRQISSPNVEDVALRDYSRPMLVTPGPIPAVEHKRITLSLSDFTKRLLEAGRCEPDDVCGIYLEDVFALPVVQQPEGNFGFVSVVPGILTQFSLAKQFGTIGILAHNSGTVKDFFRISLGQEIDVVYGSGKAKKFYTYDIMRFRALTPASVHSEFEDIDGRIYSADELFRLVYTGGGVTLQACIDTNGDAPGQIDGGRLFVLAKEINHLRP